MLSINQKLCIIKGFWGIFSVKQTQKQPLQRNVLLPCRPSLKLQPPAPALSAEVQSEGKHMFNVCRKPSGISDISGAQFLNLENM